MVDRDGHVFRLLFRVPVEQIVSDKIFTLKKNTTVKCSRLKVKPRLWILQNNGETVSLEPETFPIAVAFVVNVILKLSFSCCPLTTCTKTQNDYKHMNWPKIQNSISKQSYFSFSLFHSYFFSGQRFNLALKLHRFLWQKVWKARSFSHNTMLVAFILIQTISDIWSMLHQFSLYVKHGRKLQLFSIIEEYIHEF